MHHSPLCCGAELQGPAKFVGGPRADHSALTWSRYLGWESLTPLSERFRASRIIPVLTSLHVSRAAVEFCPALQLPCKSTTVLSAPLRNRANPWQCERDDSTLPDQALDSGLDLRHGLQRGSADCTSAGMLHYSSSVCSRCFFLLLDLR